MKTESEREEGERKIDGVGETESGNRERNQAWRSRNNCFLSFNCVNCGATMTLPLGPVKPPHGLAFEYLTPDWHTPK